MRKINNFKKNKNKSIKKNSLNKINGFSLRADNKPRGNINEKIDKYQSLARDAFSSGDRIAGENFRQHAEHFLRVNSANKKINT
tara:strand:- start:2529 stop:2780 length:252 start_codon:yes stop_codon:yes gene_type:complete